MSPLITTFAGISIYPLGLTRGVSSATCFIAKVDTSASQDRSYAIASISDGTVYLGGCDIYYSPYRTYLTKLNKNLTSAWVVGDSNSNGSERVNCLRVLEDGTIYFTDVPKNTSSFASLVKVSSTGSQLWNRALTGVGSGAGNVAFGVSGEVYLGTTADYNNNDTTARRTVVAKYNSSGVIQWQRYVTGGWTYQGSYGIAASTSTGNVYKAYSNSSNGSTNWPGIAKLNSSGTLQWASVWPIGYHSYQVQNNLAIDASENVYWAGSDGTSVVNVAKLNSSGVEQWKRNYTLTNFNNFRSLALDSAGNVYLTGSDGTGIVVVKYNSSGVIQWQRRMVLTGATLTIENDNSIQAAAGTIMFTASTTNSFFFRMPDDGSATGSYTLNGQTFTWSSISGTDAAGVRAFTVDGSVWSGTSAGSDGAGGLSMTTGSQTLTTRTLP